MEWFVFDLRYGISREGLFTFESSSTGSIVFYGVDFMYLAASGLFGGLWGVSSPRSDSLCTLSFGYIILDYACSDNAISITFFFRRGALKLLDFSISGASEIENSDSVAGVFD